MPRLTQQQRRERTRRALLDSAAHVFADKGFNGASIEQISEQAGLSRGAFYAHFTNKDELFLAVLDQMIDDIQVFATEAPETVGPQALLDAMAGVAVGHSRVRPPWFRLYSEFRSHALRDEPTRARLAAHYQRLRTAVSDVIEAQLAAVGVTPPMKTPELASVLIALDEGIAVQQGVDPDAIPPDLFITTLRTLLEAIAALDHRRRSPP